jgi:hypothetical protein
MKEGWQGHHRRLVVAGLVAALVGAALVSGVGPAGAKLQAGPTQVHPDVPVTATDQGLGLANNSPLLVADPDDPRFVVIANRLDAPDFGCALQVSGDGGQTWLTADPVPTLPPAAEKCYAPEVAFDREGVLYYLFVGLAGTGNEPIGAFLTSSANRGRHWSPPRQVLPPFSFSVRMAIDPHFGQAGRIHLVWIRASDPPLGGFAPPPNPIFAAHSDDGGETFSIPVQVSDPQRDLVVAPALALGTDHAVHIAYFDLGRDQVDYRGLEGPTFEGTWSVVVASSADSGTSFGPSVLVDNGLVPSGRIMLVLTMPPPALVAHEDRLCVAWSDARHGDDDAFARCSENRGQSWGPLRRLNDDEQGSGASQYLPALAFAPNGRMDAVFFDRRADPTNKRADVSYTYSLDGGRFTPNLALNRMPSEIEIGQRYAVPSAEGLVEFGSRLGLLARPTDALAAWPDTRNAYRPMTSQDLFAAEVDVPRPTRANDYRLLGAALLLIGCIATASVLRANRRSSDVKQ